MIAFVVRRVLQGIVVMLVVAFIAFALFNFVGDPVALMLPPEATQADRDTMRAAPGIGITAPHVGVLKRLVVIQLPDAAQDTKGLDIRFRARPRPITG